MTYNFDPERWYENERSLIEREYKSGKKNIEQYMEAIEALYSRYDEMTDRLDGTYQIPNKEQ